MVCHCGIRWALNSQVQTEVGVRCKKDGEGVDVEIEVDREERAEIARVMSRAFAGQRRLDQR